MLSILDSSASSWPGVQQAAADVAALGQAALERMADAEARSAAAEASGAALHARLAAADKALAGARQVGAQP